MFATVHTYCMTGDRQRWNEKFLAGEAQSPEPDPLLPEVCSALPPGRALDLAGGAGRHAIWLAQRGWHVRLTDVSDQGLAIAAARAAEARVSLEMRRESAADSLHASIQSGEKFDLIAVFWFLVREHFAALPALLAPGGVVLMKTFTAENARFAGGTPPRFALRPRELRDAFPALETILYRESAGVAELAARAR
jgi:tellurite methyltransferase